MIQKAKSSLNFKRKLYKTSSINPSLPAHSTILHSRLILSKLRNMFIKQGNRSHSFFIVMHALNQI
jgi:hypothetical protein